MRSLTLLSLAVAILTACTRNTEVQTIGSIEYLDPSLSAIIPENASVEILAEGFEWSEGPVWVESLEMLLFSDIPNNKVMKWTAAGGLEDYLAPSGFTGTFTDALEEGSNGLILDQEGRLLLCQHGDRRIARMDAPLDDPAPVFVTIAAQYDSMRFNSPNDAVMNRAGEIFFTDPPYGLTHGAEDSLKEIPFQGVYKIGTDGTVLLLIDSLTRPNGIGLSLDEKTLYVANSDSQKARWYVYELTGDSISSGRILYDVTNETGSQPGLPDGLAVHSGGNIFATGPGGVWILSPAGKLLGRIVLPNSTANCTLDSNERTLYITSDMYLLRVKLM